MPQIHIRVLECIFDASDKERIIRSVIEACVLAAEARV